MTLTLAEMAGEVQTKSKAGSGRRLTLAEMAGEDRATAGEIPPSAISLDAAAVQKMLRSQPYTEFGRVEDPDELEQIRKAGIKAREIEAQLSPLMVGRDILTGPGRGDRPIPTAPPIAKGRLWTEQELSAATERMRAEPHEFTAEDRAALARAEAALHPIQSKPAQIKAIISYGLGSVLNIGDLAGKGTVESLRKDLEEIPGYARAGAEAASDTVRTALEWYVVYPALFKAAGLAKYVPGSKTVAEAVKKAVGLDRLAAIAPRIERVIGTTLKAAGKGAVAGAGHAAIAAYNSGAEWDETLDAMREEALTMAGIAAAFNVAGSIDVQLYINDLRASAMRASNAKFARLSEEIKTSYPAGPHKTSMVRGLSVMKRLDVQKLDKVLSQIEAELIGAKASDLYKRGPKYRPSVYEILDQINAPRLVSEVYQGVPGLEKGYIQPSRDILTGQPIRHTPGAAIERAPRVGPTVEAAAKQVAAKAPAGATQATPPAAAGPLASMLQTPAAAPAPDLPPITEVMQEVQAQKKEEATKPAAGRIGPTVEAAKALKQEQPTQPEAEVERIPIPEQAKQLGYKAPDDFWKTNNLSNEQLAGELDVINAIMADEKAPAPVKKWLKARLRLLNSEADIRKMVAQAATPPVKATHAATEGQTPVKAAQTTPEGQIEAPAQKSEETKAPADMTLEEFEATGHRPADVTKDQWVQIMRRHMEGLGQPEESGTLAAPYSDYEQYWENDVKDAQSQMEPETTQPRAEQAKQAWEMTQAEYTEHIRPTDNAKDIKEFASRLRGPAEKLWSRKKAVDIAERLRKEGWIVTNPQEAQNTESVYFGAKSKDGRLIGIRVSGHSSGGPIPSTGLRGTGSELNVVKTTKIDAVIRAAEKRAVRPTHSGHQEEIQIAVSENKPVPRAVLEEYAGQPWADEALAKMGEQATVKESLTVEPRAEAAIGIQSLPTRSIGTDPDTFQFKGEATGPGGVGETLRGVTKWNPKAAGVILVWQDRQGRYWVVDGHHRLWLATKLDVENINAFVVREADGVTAQEARLMGAMSNLADGKGTAIDAAKVFRDSNITTEELHAQGVDVNNAIVRQGLAMKNLSDPVFRMVIDGKLPANMAAEIGKHVANPTQQMQVAQLVADGKVDSAREAELLAKTINSAPVLTRTEQTLFGAETTEKSLYAERAKVLANVEKILKTNRKIFGVLAQNAGKIEQVGNVLARDANQGIKERADEILYLLEKLVDAKGPVSEALNNATVRYAEKPTKERLTEITRDLLAQWEATLRIPTVRQVRPGVSEPVQVRQAGAVGLVKPPTAAKATQPAEPAGAEVGKVLSEQPAETPASEAPFTPPTTEATEAPQPRGAGRPIILRSVRGDDSYVRFELKGNDTYDAIVVRDGSEAVATPAEIGQIAGRPFFRTKAEGIPGKGLREWLAKGRRQASGRTSILSDLIVEIRAISANIAAGPIKIVRSANVWLRRNINSAVGFIATLGKPGEAIANDMTGRGDREGIVYAAHRNAQRDAKDIAEVYRGLRKHSREQVAKIINGLITNPSKEMLARANAIRNVLDRAMQAARDSHTLYRRQLDGGYTEIEGTGKAFPHVPNKKGRKTLDDAIKKGLASARVYVWASGQVEAGRFETIDQAVAALQQYASHALRGLAPTYERVRTDFLKDDEIEWDGVTFLARKLERDWLIIEASKRWTTPRDEPGPTGFDKLEPKLLAIATKHGQDVADRVRMFIETSFGRMGPSSRAAESWWNAWRSWQFHTKVALSAPTIARNAADRIAKMFTIIQHPLLSIEAFVRYPPVLNMFIPSARRLEADMIRRGLIFGHGSLSEGYEAGSLFTSVLGHPFSASERGNQVFIALVKYLQLQHDIARLQKRQGKDGIATRLANRLHVAITDPVKYRLAEHGGERLLAAVIDGSQSVDELVDEVIHNTVREKAFPITILTKPIWWDAHPGWRTAFQFKTWPVKQLTMIWRDVVKYTVKTGDPSRLIGFLLGTLIAGELYNLITDWLYGRDEALLSQIGEEPEKILKAIKKDFLDGGGVGMLSDFTYGLYDWAIGPTGSTLLKNMPTTITHIVKRPRLAAQALGEFFKREVPPVRHTLAIIDKIDRGITKDPANITEDFFRVRNWAWQFKDGYLNPTTLDKFHKLADDFMWGRPHYAPGENTLAYQMASRQLQVGDIDDAAEYFALILAEASTKDYKTVTGTIQRTMRSNYSPFGHVAQERRKAFLAALPVKQRQLASDTQRQWERNFSQAMNKAHRIAKEIRAKRR